MGTSIAICGNVGNHAFVECDLLDLARHLAQINHYTVYLGYPH
jgi:hypothetical protein